MTLSFSSLLLVVAFCNYYISRLDSFQIPFAKHSLNRELLTRSSKSCFSVLPLSVRSTKALFNSPQLVEDEQVAQEFNTNAIIPKERWDFADDIYLITTTEIGSQRLQRTKEQLEKVNMLNKVKIRTFKPDDEDRVRGKSSEK